MVPPNQSSEMKPNSLPLKPWPHMSGRLVVALTNCPPSLVPDLSSRLPLRSSHSPWAAVLLMYCSRGSPSRKVRLRCVRRRRRHWRTCAGSRRRRGSPPCFVVRRQAAARRRQVAGIGLPAGQGRRHVQAFVEPLAEPSLDPFVATREIVYAMHHDGHARLGRRRHQVHVAALGQGDGLGRRSSSTEPYRSWLLSLPLLGVASCQAGRFVEQHPVARFAGQAEFDGNAGNRLPVPTATLVEMNECVVAPIWLQALRPAQEHAGAGIVAEDLDLPARHPGGSSIRHSVSWQ